MENKWRRRIRLCSFYVFNVSGTMEWTEWFGLGTHYMATPIHHFEILFAKIAKQTALRHCMMAKMDFARDCKSRPTEGCEISESWRKNGQARNWVDNGPNKMPLWAILPPLSLIPNLWPLDYGGPAAIKYPLYFWKECLENWTSLTSILFDRECGWRLPFRIYMKWANKAES